MIASGMVLPDKRPGAPSQVHNLRILSPQSRYLFESWVEIYNKVGVLCGGEHADRCSCHLIVCHREELGNGTSQHLQVRHTLSTKIDMHNACAQNKIALHQPNKTCMTPLHRWKPLSRKQTGASRAVQVHCCMLREPISNKSGG